MSQIIIDINIGKTNVVYKTADNTVMPICEVTNNGFIISKSTDKDILTAVGDIMLNYGITLDYQLYKQGFINKPLNKFTDGK